MKTPISRIGYAKVIRLPQPLLDAGGFGEVVELELRPEGLLLRPVAGRREELDTMPGDRMPEQTRPAEAIWSWLD
ncbi:AbrB/MazE/SpoVT family DNA-binding domain-containing protein [Megalodesulfovibrio paquesii]